MEKRTVKIVGVTGGIQTYSTTSTTLAELKKEIDYDFSGKKVIERKSKARYTDNSVLPTEDFVFFTSPVKTKAGAIDTNNYYELRAAIKELVDNSAEAKAHFNQGGINYTNKSKVAMQLLYSSWTSQGQEVETVIQESVTVTTRPRVKDSTVTESCNHSQEIKALKDKVAQLEATLLNERNKSKSYLNIIASVHEMTEVDYNSELTENQDVTKSVEIVSTDLPSDEDLLKELGNPDDEDLLAEAKELGLLDDDGDYDYEDEDYDY
jgi:hypothetical protein